MLKESESEIEAEKEMMKWQTLNDVIFHLAYLFSIKCCPNFFKVVLCVISLQMNEKSQKNHQKCAISNFSNKITTKLHALTLATV